jgi:hypothetical protein
LNIQCNYIAIDLEKIIDEFITALGVVCEFNIPINSLLKPIISTVLESYDEDIVSKKIFILLTSSELTDPFHQDYEVIKELTNLFVSLIKNEMLNNGIIEHEQQNYFLLTVRKSGLTIIGYN